MKGKCLFTDYAKEKGKASEMYADIMAAWGNVLNSETEEEYADSVLTFREL
ncbi:hypothetical protein A2U01_0108642, partial [Trifolium medium]|nr:hypothetical protein [Trifolium medium]